MRQKYVPCWRQKIDNGRPENYEYVSVFVVGCRAELYVRRAIDDVLPDGIRLVWICLILSGKDTVDAVYLLDQQSLSPTTSRSGSKFLTGVQYDAVTRPVFRT